MVIDYSRSVMVWKRSHAPTLNLFPQSAGGSRAVASRIATAWLGRQGGKARARNLTPEQRSEGAWKAAQAR